MATAPVALDRGHERGQVGVRDALAEGSQMGFSIGPFYHTTPVQWVPVSSDRLFQRRISATWCTSVQEVAAAHLLRAGQGGAVIGNEAVPRSSPAIDVGRCPRFLPPPLPRGSATH